MGQMCLLKLGRGISVAALRQCRTRPWAFWTVRCGLSVSLTMLTARFSERLPTLKEAEEALITEALRRRQSGHRCGTPEHLAVGAESTSAPPATGALHYIGGIAVVQCKLPCQLRLHSLQSLAAPDSSLLPTPPLSGCIAGRQRTPTTPARIISH
jgi:hypothetical protein